MRLSFSPKWLVPLMLVLLASACGGSESGGTQTTVIPPMMGGSVKKSLALTPTVSTFVEGPAMFDSPSTSVSDGVYLYTTDTTLVRKTEIATGKVTTLAGSTTAGSADGIGSAAQFKWLEGITVNHAGNNLYVTDMDNHTVRKIVIATGEVTTIAGLALSGGNTDGIGSAARFNTPMGIAIDSGDSNLYVADDGNNTVRKIELASGTVSTLAGQAGVGGSADGIGAAATFTWPVGIAIDSSNNLYVTDNGNYTVRKITLPSATVSTLAGTVGIKGTTDDIGTAASFKSPYGICTDDSNVYITDWKARNLRKIVIASGAVTTVAGDPTNTSLMSPGYADGIGLAAQFGSPSGVTCAGANLFITDYNHGNLRKLVVASGAVSTLAGKANGSAGSTDGVGSASTAFDLPYGITTDGSNLYVADSRDSTIKKVSLASGAVSILAGASGQIGSADGTGAAARFSSITGITFDGSNLYVTENTSVRKIVIATGAVSTLAGSFGVYGSADAIGSAASFSSLQDITTDNVNLYVTDGDNRTVRKIVIATGAVSTLAGTTGVGGYLDGVGTAAQFVSPQGITTDGTNLYVVENARHTVRKIVIASGIVSTLAGADNVAGSADGIGTDARFKSPSRITTDGTKLYVTDYNNYTLRQIVIADSSVTTLAGTALAFGKVNGTGIAARFHGPKSMTSDGTALYLVDDINLDIRKIH